jgi:predicted SPOUT superfamily RNA methylase MTH1
MAISNRGEMGVGGGSRGGSGGGSRGRVSVSTRSSELDKATKTSVKKQNKAADSYKIKDMDALEKGQKYRAAKKAADAAAKAKALKKAETKGKIKGAAATVGLGSAMKLATFTKEDKKKTEAKKTTKKSGK